MTHTLTHAQQSTFDAILRHPAPHNLQWRDIRSLLGVIAQVTEEPSGHLKVTRGGQTLQLHPDQHKDMENWQQLKDLRQFLKQSESPVAAQSPGPVNLLVVLDHREARVFHTEMHGAVPHHISPYDPENKGRHLHRVDNDSNGQRKPERKSYYDDIAQSLIGADSILLFGAGTGASSAMDQLRAELGTHHKALMSRVVGTVVVDEHHRTEDQLLAQARAFYVAHAERVLETPQADTNTKPLAGKAP